MFAALDADDPGGFDCIWDPNNMPLDDEPASVRNELASVALDGDDR